MREVVILRNMNKIIYDDSCKITIVIYVYSNYDCERFYIKFQFIHHKMSIFENGSSSGIKIFILTSKLSKNNK